MNLITTIATIFTLWLVMGLAYLTSYANARRKGISFLESLKALPGVLFIGSVVGSLLFLAFKIF